MPMCLRRAVVAVVVLLASGIAAALPTTVVLERRFPTNFYCPFDNDDFNLTFTAESSFLRLTFVAENYVGAEWLHRRLDNITVVAKTTYDANKLVSEGYDNCYVFPGHNDTPGYNFTAAGTTEVYFNFFDGNADGWDLNRGAYWDPPATNVSAPRNPAADPPGVPFDFSGGALAMGREAAGPGLVTTSVLLSGLTPGIQYIVTGWWNVDWQLSPVTITMDSAPCLDRDADGVTECTDCDDRNPKRKPGLAEVCDGYDNNCDGVVDESTPCDRVCDAPSKIGTDLRVTNASFISASPSLVWNGTDFALFYKDSRNGGQDLYFSRVSTAGVKIGSDVNLTPSGGSTEKQRAVWTGSEYGVVWEDGGIVAFRRFDRNGAPIGALVPLGSGSPGAFTPDIVWTGKEYGLVWAQFVATPEIFFTRLASDGTSLMIPIQLSAGSSPQDPRLAWNGVHYGVVWQGSSGVQQLYFRRVAPLDASSGSAIQLTTGLGGSFAPAIAAGGGEWAVAWADYRDSFEPEIYKCAISAAGTKTGIDRRVTNATGGSINPSIAWSGSEWGLTWEDFRSGDSEQWFGRMAFVGGKLGTDFRVTSAAGTSQQASVAWAGGKFAAAWNDDRDSDQEIYFARLGCDCVDSDADTFSSCVDCDDGRGAVKPGGAQICDALNNDCNDVNWPLLAGTNEVDADVDGFTVCAGDCADGNAAVWATPGEARSLILGKFGTTAQLGWLAPTSPGGTALAYDTIRSATPSNFVASAVCVETNDGTNTASADVTNPAPGGRFFYLIRAENACPSGLGPLGNSSAGVARTGRTCP